MPARPRKCIGKKVRLKKIIDSQFTEFNMIITVAAFGFGLTQLLFLYGVLKVSVFGKGEKAPARPWEGADTLEWTHLPSPAPYHSFHEQPVVK